MTRLPSLTAAEVIRAPERGGWRFKRATGSHRYFAHPHRPGLVCVPFHTRDVKRGTLHGIIKTTGLTVDEFVALL